MNNPYHDIERAKKFISILTDDLEKIKNPKVKEFRIDALNSFISLINSFEAFLEQKYKLRSLEGLLCSRLYTMIFTSISNNEAISIHEIVRKIDHDISYPEARKEALVSSLFTENLKRSIKSSNKLPSECSKDWLVLVDDLLFQIKSQLIWN
ncbi:hypothetical protein [Tenacibaculum sp. nBUS_03]|uniref:hypothetical protein n=1 Tax=Tenacibaculum sp. nBUS_03 TaxID=3395320 RepID=UPI003EBF1539